MLGPADPMTEWVPVLEFNPFGKITVTFQTTGSTTGRGEVISMAFVESMLNQVVSRRFVEKQQVHWGRWGSAPVPANADKGLEYRMKGRVSALAPLFRIQANAFLGFLLLLSYLSFQLERATTADTDKREREWIEPNGSYIEP